jgi:hypothetical protein
MNGQKSIAVMSRQPSSTHGKLMMQMLGDAHEEDSETAAESYPIIIRSYEPVADLDDRLARIFAVLSLPPLEELKLLDLALHTPLRARRAN